MEMDSFGEKQKDVLLAGQEASQTLGPVRPSPTTTVPPAVHPVQQMAAMLARTLLDPTPKNFKMWGEVMPGSVEVEEEVDVDVEVEVVVVWAKTGTVQTRTQKATRRQRAITTA